MATLLTDETLCKVGDDEPIFVLRAQDATAPTVVMHWVQLNMHGGSTPTAKIAEAIDLARVMEAWQREHGCKMPD